MKVVHINFSSTKGGAAIAAYRHCEAMRKAGIDASMLVFNDNKKSSFVYRVDRNNLKFRFKSLLYPSLHVLMSRLFKFKGTFSYPILSLSIANHPLVQQADIIYFHWISFSMLSTKEIERILKLGKTVRWYMHDMYPITGGCHHAFDCTKYTSSCKLCPLISRTLPLFDLAKKQFVHRLKSWTKYSNFEAYTPSSWLAESVKKSAIWQGHKVTVFPNVLDTEKFHIVNKEFARNVLNIKTDKKLVLFGADVINDFYKGWNYLQEALNSLDPSRYEALIFGNCNDSISDNLHVHCSFTGYLNDEYSLILAYNAADVLVSSSIAENYPNVIMEAMSCGLPCVGFNIGGIPEQIYHKQNGYLANIECKQSLADGIQYVCTLSEEEYCQMRMNARSFVVNEASYEKYKGHL